MDHSGDNSPSYGPGYYIGTKQLRGFVRPPRQLTGDTVSDSESGAGIHTQATARGLCSHPPTGTAFRQAASIPPSHPVREWEGRSSPSALYLLRRLQLQLTPHPAAPAKGCLDFCAPP